MQEKLLRVLGYLAANVECGVAGKVTTCAWLLGVHIQKRWGVPYIYSSIAYDSRRGCGNARVQWGGHLPAHERTTHIRQQVVRMITLARFKTAQKLFHFFPSFFCSDDSWLCYALSSLAYFLIKRKIIFKYLLT